MKIHLHQMNRQHLFFLGEMQEVFADAHYDRVSLNTGRSVLKIDELQRNS